MVKRNIYLINPRFQLKFSFFMSILVFIPSFIYPFIIYRTIVIIAGLIDTPGVEENLYAHRTKLIFLLFLWQLAFTALVFIICIFQSHKIAGPMYKLKKYLTSIKEGNRPKHIFFRKGDNFQDIAEDFNQAFDTITETHKSNFQEIGDILEDVNKLKNSSSTDNLDELNKISNKIAGLQEKLRS